MHDFLQTITKETTPHTIQTVLDNFQQSPHLYRDYHGASLLHYAAKVDNAELCEYLLTTIGLYINDMDTRNGTPLYYAAYHGSNDAVRCLLRFNCNPTMRSAFSGMNAFEKAQGEAKVMIERVMIKQEVAKVFYPCLIDYRYSNVARNDLFCKVHPRGNTAIEGYLADVEDRDIDDIVRECKERDAVFFERVEQTLMSVRTMSEAFPVVNLNEILEEEDYDREDSMAYYMLYSVYVYNLEYEKGFEFLNRSQNPMALFEYAQVLLHGNNDESRELAINILDNIKDMLSEASVLLSGFIVSEDPNVQDLISGLNEAEKDALIEESKRIIENEPVKEPVEEKKGKIEYEKALEAEKNGNIELAIDLMEKACENNYPQALCDMGFFYLTGNYFDKNYATALEYLKRACAFDHCESLLNVGKMYYLGDGVERDLNTSFEYLKRCVDCKEFLDAKGEAHLLLAKFYVNGKGPVEAKEIETFVHLEKAEIVFPARAQKKKALWMYKGKGCITKNEERGMELLLELYSRGQIDYATVMKATLGWY
eukprot:TRINITY_DN7043_c0_g1_i2.p1 TRINITY_DN7043_c0_g1~~TRINITY_DN7043_c0_g1_i2.p1  ORF type:complete len:538 (-),score=110.52 TRINITY_DN7043_c0_g1_i2:22-1635(-)